MDKASDDGRRLPSAGEDLARARLEPDTPQTSKAEPMPILLFDEKYWRRIINFEVMAEEGVIAPADLQLFRYAESAEAAWRAICVHYGLDPALADEAS